MVRKTYVAMMFCMLVLSVLYAAEGVSADMQKPIWNEGDYWQYDVDINIGEGLTIGGTEQIEVKSTKTITIDGSQYVARMVVITKEISTEISGIPINMSADGIGYYRETDFSLMKLVVDDPTGHSETVYSYPFIGIDWPIAVGKSWERTTTVTVTNASGTTASDITYYCECTGETDVNTLAGLFLRCYIVKVYEDEKTEQDYHISYFSPDVGYANVRFEKYSEGALSFSQELTSFKYSSSSTSDEATDGGRSTPGFELLFIVCAMALILFWKRKR